MTIEYRPSRTNAVSDAIGMKGQLATLEEEEDRVTRGRSQVHMTHEMQNKLWESIGSDTQAQIIVN